MKNQMKAPKILILSAVMILLISSLTGCGESEEPNALEDMALIDVIDQIYEIHPMVLDTFSDNIDIADPDIMVYNTGLTDLSNVKEAAISETMMGSQAYSLVLVRVNEESGVADVANAVKTGINPAKWVCVEADDLQVVSYRDVVMLIMVSSEYSDSVTSQQIVDAFQQICGAEVTSY